MNQMRSDLSNDQIHRYAYMFCSWLLGAPLTFQTQMYCAKVLFTLVDPIVRGFSQEQAAIMCATISETCVEKIKSLVLIFQTVVARLEKREGANGDDILDVTYIEKDRPCSAAYYATENPEGLLNGKVAHNILRKCTEVDLGFL